MRSTILVFLLIAIYLTPYAYSVAPIDSNDPCVYPMDGLSGVLDVSRADTDEFCWRIIPWEGPTEQPVKVVLNFERFNFDGDFFLYIYDTELPLDKGFVGMYQATSPGLITIHSRKVLLIAQGNNSQTTLYGGRDFRVEWDSQGTELELSLNTFYALVLIFIFPFTGLFLSVFLQKPCNKKKNPKKFARVELGLFIAGFLLGLLLFALTLPRELIQD